MKVIEFEGVSKIYGRQSRQFFLRYLTQAWKKRRNEAIRALSDISFHVLDGESLAVVGNNGAGKSTLLNLVAGLTQPESGQVTVRGRVAALLELGSGFHGDLTAAENLRVNAALLGLTRQQTEESYASIVEFSELGAFMGEPLRTFSAGMTLRLAFSIAVHVEARILLLDEVLAVGDQEFRQKCVDKIFALKRSGKVLLCVSHVPELLTELCEHTLWLDSGRMVRHGPTAEVLPAYLEQAATQRFNRK